MSSEKDKLTGFVTGLLVGGVIGGVLAILFTPVSGRKMRKNISRTTDNIIDNVSDILGTGKELIKDGKKKATSIIEDAKKIVSN
jgi:gas vesicle protein